MQTNHLSHYLLTLGLVPALQRGAQQPPQPQQQQQSPPGTDGFRPRIVSVASAMHHFGYKFGPTDPLQKQSYSTTLAYGNSKLAQVCVCGVFLFEGCGCLMCARWCRLQPLCPLHVPSPPAT